MKMLLSLLAAAAALGQTPAASPFAKLTGEDLAKGKRVYEAQCALCHGMTGTGGRGANLTNGKFKHASDDAGLVEVVRNGVRDSEMPGAWWMSERESVQVAYYVGSLSKVAGNMKVAGSIPNGREIFEGKGGCSGCHIVAGRGGSMGPELTDIGARRSPEHLRASILNPAASVPDGFLVVRVQTKAGKEHKGIRLNEDSFTIQLKDLSGEFLSFRKQDVAGIFKDTGESPMPGYQGKLSDSELDDLIAYLNSLRGESK